VSVVDTEVATGFTRRSLFTRLLPMLVVPTRRLLAEALWDTGTFSILGFDPQSGEVGGAVQSRVFSVGNGVLWADANVGVAATQAIVDVSYGAQGYRPASGELDQAGAAVRGHESKRGVRRVYRSEGNRLGRT
jgi:hypothetical protein